MEFIFQAFGESFEFDPEDFASKTTPSESNIKKYRGTTTNIVPANVCVHSHGHHATYSPAATLDKKEIMIISKLETAEEGNAIPRQAS